MMVGRIMMPSMMEAVTILFAAAEHGLQGRDEHDKAEEAIDDGRDA